MTEPAVICPNWKTEMNSPSATRKAQAPGLPYLPDKCCLARPARPHDQDHPRVLQGLLRSPFYKPLEYAISESRAIGIIGIGELGTNSRPIGSQGSAIRDLRTRVRRFLGVRRSWRIGLAEAPIVGGSMATGWRRSHRHAFLGGSSSMPRGRGGGGAHGSLETASARGNRVPWSRPIRGEAA